MIEWVVAPSPPNLSSGKLSEPRPLIVPSFVFFDIANSFIFEYSPLYSPVRAHPSVFVVLTACRGSAFHVMFRLPSYIYL